MASGSFLTACRSLSLQPKAALIILPPNNHINTNNNNNTKIILRTCNICSNSLKPHKKLSTILVEKFVGFVIGTVLFVGYFNVGAGVAAPVPAAQKSSYGSYSSSANSEEDDEEKMYEEMLEGDPKNVVALKVVVCGKMRRGNTKEAVKYAERLIDVEPQEVEWRLLMALCYEIMGQFDIAKTLYEQVLVDRPLFLRALHGLALAMHKNNEGPAVFVMLNKALEIAQREKRVTEERNIRILIAQMHVVKGELEEGLNKFQDLVNADPRDFRPYLCQGIIYSLLDQKKEAAEQFETYRALVPEESPQRGFLDDVVLAAQTKSGELFKKDFDAEFSSRK